MKKILLSLILASSCLSIFAKDRISHEINDLPQRSIEMINNHFKDKSISYIKTEGWSIGREYEVVFTDGVNLEFNYEGFWKEIKSKKDTIPQSLIPENVKSYLSEKYPNFKIKKIEEKRKTYELKLNNCLELHFNKTEKFIRFDD